MLFWGKKRKRVLVVDDEEAIVEFLSDILATWNIEATECRSLGEVVSELKRNRYDLIISDINMSTESGYEVLKILQDRQLDIPLILMSGAVNIYDDDNCPQQIYKKIHSYLQKPFSINELKEHIDAAFREHQQRKVA